jgi:hypothetical protein
MNKAQANSVLRIKQAIDLIERTAPPELKRFSQKRKRDMEQAWSSLTLHAHKIGIKTPNMGTWYRPQEYLSHIQVVKRALSAWEATK